MNRLTRALAAVIPALLLVAACGGGSGGDNGLKDKSAADILAASKAAFSSAKSVHVVGAMTKGSDAFEIDMRVTSGAESTGTVTISGSKIEIIRIGDSLYMKAPGDFYTKNGAPSVAAQLLTGKYLK